MGRFWLTFKNPTEVTAYFLKPWNTILYGLEKLNTGDVKKNGISKIFLNMQCPTVSPKANV